MIESDPDTPSENLHTPEEDTDTHHSPSQPEEAASTNSLMALTLAIEGGMLLVSVVLGWWLGIRFWEGLDWSWGVLSWSILWTIPLAIIFIVSIESAWKFTAQVKEDLSRFIAHLEKCNVGHLLIMSVLAGLGEEALFRGVLLPWTAEYIGIIGALTITSLLFGFAHFISKEYMIGTTIIGFFLGGLYLWHDNILIPMAVHGLYDFIALVYAVKIRPLGKP